MANADGYLRDPYATMLSDVVSRIKRAMRPTFVYAVGREVVTCGKDSKRKLKKLEEEGTLIGVYTGAVQRDDLSADISMVVDEIPDPDEVRHDKN